MARLTRSMHSRFLSIVIRVAIASTVVAALVIYQLSLVNQRHEGEDVVRGLVSAMGRTAEIGLFAQDVVLLQELADGLTRHPFVRAASISDKAGQPLVLGPVASGVAASKTVPATAPPDYETALFSPFDRSEQVGSLRVWFNQRAIVDKARQQAGALIVAMLLLMLGVVVAFNAVALRALSRPMHRLADELTSMKPGSGTRLTLEAAHEQDELGSVVVAANRLLDEHDQAIDQERGMRMEVARMESQYRQIFDTTSAGIFVLGPGGRLINSNRAVCRAIAADEDAMRHLRETDFAATVFCDRARWDATVARARESGATATADLEIRRLDGTTRWVHCLVSVQEGADGGQTSIVEGVLYDVTQRRLAETKAAHQAEFDPLTGVLNRRGIERMLAQKVEDARHDGSSLTLLFIDLDGFKAVNDSFGHEAGDAVLVECARRLRGALRRKSDVVGRLGGDELMLLLDKADPSEAVVQEVARQTVKLLAEPILVLSGRTAQVGASVGVAGFPRQAGDAAELLRKADAAMYQVKKNGKGGFAVASNE